MTDTELLACPFCGKPVALNFVDCWDEYHVYCNNCCLSVEKNDKDKTLSIWNTRNYDYLKVKIEALRVNMAKTIYTQQFPNLKVVEHKARNAAIDEVLEILKND